MKGCRAHTRKMNLALSGTAEHRKLIGILGLGLRNVWCKFEKDQTNLAPRWPQMELQGAENQLCLDLNPTHIWCEYERKSVENSAL